MTTLPVPAHEWKLGETATASWPAGPSFADTGNSAENAPGYNSGSYLGPGRFHSCSYFGDRDYFIDCGDPSDLRIDENEFTFTVWIKIPNTEPNNRNVFSKHGYRYTGVLTQAYYFRASNNKRHIDAIKRDSSNTLYRVEETGTTFDNDFHFYVFTYQNGSASLYRDDVLQDSESFGVTTKENDSITFRIGNSHLSGSGWSTGAGDGAIDHLRFYTQAITEEEAHLFYLETEPPIIENQDPADSETEVLVTSPVYYEIRNSASLGDDYHHAWIDFGDGEVLIYSSGSWQNGHTGSIVAYGNTGFDVTLQPSESFGYGDTINVRAVAGEYVFTNQVEETWSFETSNTAPITIDIQPDNAARINPHRHFIIDYESVTAIDLSYLTVEIDRGEGSGYEMAYSSSAFQTGFNGGVTEETSGAVYTVLIETYPESIFENDKIINVRAKSLYPGADETVETKQYKTLKILSEYAEEKFPVTPIKIDKTDINTRKFSNIIDRAVKVEQNDELSQEERNRIKKEIAKWIDREPDIPFSFEDKRYIPVELEYLDVGKDDFENRKTMAIKKGASKLLDYDFKVYNKNVFNVFKYEDYYLDALPGARLKFLISINKKDLELFEDKEKEKVEKVVKMKWGDFVNKVGNINKKINKIVKDK